MTIVYILIFILVLAIVVCFHEFGHFIFAKKANILVNEFAFGMGPKLFTKKKGETYWSIRALPIGGFCAMSGEDESLSYFKVGDEVCLKLNNDNKVEKIIINKKSKEYTIDNDSPNKSIIVNVENFDLMGKNNTSLFINEYEVKRDALILINDKEEYKIAPEERNFFSKSVWQRFLVCFGGPLNNIILAFVVFLILGLVSGTPNENSNVIGTVSSNSPADIAGIKAGDKITSIAGKEINSFSSISDAIYGTHNRELNIVVYRDDEKIESTVYAQYYIQNLGFSSKPYSEEDGDKVIIITRSDSALGGKSSTKAYKDGGLENNDEIISIKYNGIEYSIGNWDDLLDVSLNTIDGGNVTITYKRDGVNNVTTYAAYSDKLLDSQGYEAAYKQVGISSTTSFNFISGIINGFEYLWDSSKVIFSTLGLLLFSKEVGLKDMGSFLSILDQTATAASGGILNLLYWVGMLSINLGIVNLLPIPALDGGRILFLIIEKITGKKVNPKVESILINVAFWILLALIGYITIQDIIRMVAKFGAIF